MTSSILKLNTHHCITIRTITPAATGISSPIIFAVIHTSVRTSISADRLPTTTFATVHFSNYCPPLHLSSNATFSTFSLDPFFGASVLIANITAFAFTTLFCPCIISVTTPSRLDFTVFFLCSSLISKLNPYYCSVDTLSKLLVLVSDVSIDPSLLESKSHSCVIDHMKVWPSIHHFNIFPDSKSSAPAVVRSFACSFFLSFLPGSYWWTRAVWYESWRACMSSSFFGTVCFIPQVNIWNSFSTWVATALITCIAGWSFFK